MPCLTALLQTFHAQEKAQAITGELGVHGESGHQPSLTCPEGSLPIVRAESANEAAEGHAWNVPLN